MSINVISTVTVTCQYYLHSGTPVQYPVISVGSSFMNKYAGDYLSISSNVTTAESALVYVCFVNNYTFPNIVLGDLNFYCLQCSAFIGRQCKSQGNVTLPQEHRFNITSKYISNCSSKYALTVHKHHLSTGDNGVVVFLTYTGGSYLNKTVKLYIKQAKFDKEYIIFLTTGVSILIIFCFSLVIVYIVKQKKASSAYISIPQSSSDIISKYMIYV